ncbi:hypothetical protein F0223_06350 [Vibrio coralliilyticus]|uniref:hypothetical protein n=1 Tax=Vibrio TaxID=662 RepID=UPI0005003E13|nr:MULTISPECIES: hypothetical protein [Vibrio]KFI12944.1 hypothetical protein IX95_03070 [Vibrio sp. B183]NOI17851.1 hypothetical protein [Vibrio coralliilyticus]
MKKERYIVMATYLAVIVGLVLSYFLSTIGYVVLVGVAGWCVFARKGHFASDSQRHFNLVLQSIGMLAVFQLLSVGLALAALNVETLEFMGVIMLTSKITKFAGFILPLLRVTKGLKNIDYGVAA